MERPAVGVGAFLARDGQIVVLRRKSPEGHGDGEWCIPGGHLETGEGLAECAAREVAEEVGIHLDSDAFRVVAVMNFPRPDGAHYLDVFCVCDLPTGVEPFVAEPHKATDIRWCRPGEVPRPVFSPLARFLERRDSSSILDGVIVIDEGLVDE